MVSVTSEKKEKACLGSWFIFLGLIFLFMGDGANIQIANNAPFFILSVAYSVFMIVFRNKKITLNFATCCLLILFVFTLFYWRMGKYDFGTTMSLFLNIILILATSITSTNNKDIERIMKGIICSAVIFGLLLMFFGKGYSGAIYDKTTYTQTFGKKVEFEPNFLGLLLVTGFEFCVWAIIRKAETGDKNGIVIYMACAAVTFISTLMTGSRSTLVVIAIYGILLICFIKNHRTRNRLLAAVLLLIVVLVIAVHTGLISQSIYARLFENSYSDGSNVKRLENWRHGLMVMRDHFFGMGPFNSAAISYALYGYPSAVHNTFIAFGAYYGVIGFLTFAIFIIVLAIRAWRFKQRELFAMIVSMIFEWNILECQHTLSMWIFIMICVLITNRLNNGEKLDVF